MSLRVFGPNSPDAQKWKDVEHELTLMMADTTYNTESSYSSKIDLYPDNQMPFVDKHMNYLRAHTGTDPWQYISNLKLMTRVKQ